MRKQQFRNKTLGYVLKRAQYPLRQAMDDRLADAALTTPQYAALTALERGEGGTLQR